MTIGIQFGGLASGLDSGAIIDAILAVEGRAVRVLEGRKEDEREKLSLLGTFEGLVSKLRDKVRDLQLDSNFFAHELTLGEEGIAAFTLAGNAQAGAHELEVTSLASADRYAFAGVADRAAALTPGTLGFSYGGTAYSVSLAAGSDLDDLAAAINAAAGEAVTATVVNVGTSAAPSYQLVIAGDDTGADFAITGLASSVTELGLAEHISSASNAVAVVDGLTVQRSSNLFSDVLPGISFTVSRTTTTPLSFTVDLDPAGIKANIQGFVEAYNEVVRFIGDQNTFSLEGGPGGLLFGDGALSSIQTTLRRALFTPDLAMLAANEAYGSLGIVGIELQADGTLDIDEERLDEKLSGDLDAFEQFFNRADDASTTGVDERGVFVRVQEMLADLLDGQTSLDGQSTIEGVLKARKTAIGQRVEDFDDEIERLQFRLDGLEESLVRKFAALEQVMSGLQGQQAFLSSIANLGTRR
jgi:flagellar hook-associated protein 2